MRLLPLRTTAAAALAALPISLLAPLPSTAVIASDTVRFTDCEVLKESVRLPGESTWTPTVTLDHPSPVPAASAQTIEVVLSELPGGTFPEDYPQEVNLRVLLDFEDGQGSVITYEATRPLASFDASQPLPVGEFETDLTYSSSGVYDFKPKSVNIELFGVQDPDTFDFIEFDYVCDQVVDDDPISQIRVYDPNAAASISLNRLTARQGDSVAVSGKDFPRESVEDPDKDVSVFVGTLLAGSFDVDDIGSFAGVVRIPEFAKPGAAVTLRASDPAESATVTLGISVKAGSVKVSRTVVKPGSKLTVTGAKFKPGETVRIVLTKAGPGKGTKRYAVGAKVGATGSFAKTVTLKKAAKGSWRVTVTGPGSFRKAGTGFRVR